MTRTLPWYSRRSLIDAIPADPRLAELIAGEFVNYKVVGSPTIIPVGNNPNIISCEFEIEREDYSQSWAAVKSVFKGRLRIEKNTSGTAIKFILTHTARETKDLNRKFVKHLTEMFKKNGDVKKDAEIETIRFSSFDNERRFAFFQSLVGNTVPVGFEFVEMTDFGVCPDPSLELPSDVDWMEDKVSGLKINGVALQDIFLLKDSGYHKFFFLHSIEAKFKFDTKTAKGTCLVVFEFPDFMREKDSSTEFEVNISKLNLDAGCSVLNKVVFKEELLRRINEFKLSQFEKFKLRPLAQSAVQLEATMDWG